MTDFTNEGKEFIIYTSPDWFKIVSTTYRSFGFWGFGWRTSKTNVPNPGKLV